MNCTRTLSLLSAYLDGELGGHEMLDVREHLRGCPSCETELSEIRAVKQILSGLAAPAPSDDFEARLKMAVFRETPTRRPVPLRGLVAGFGALAAAFAVWLILQPQPEPAKIMVNSQFPSEIARDQAFVAGGDPLTGHVPVMPVNYGR